MIFDRRSPNRAPATFIQAINPLWWMGDVTRPPGPSWWFWFKRNPFNNLCNVILGNAHCPRRVAWKVGAGYTYPVKGWNYGYQIVDGGFFPYFFVAHRGSWKEWGFGWMTSGVFFINWRNANSNQYRPEAP